MKTTIMLGDRAYKDRAGDCLKSRLVSIYDECRVHFPQLPGGLGEFK